MNDIIINGIPLYTRRDSVSWFYGQHRTDLKFTLGDKNQINVNPLAVQGLDGEFILKDESEYDALIAELDHYGALAVCVEPSTYFQALHMGVQHSTPSVNRVFKVRLVQDALLRLVDCFKYANTLESVTSWTDSPDPAYMQQTSGNQALLAGAGLVLTGSGSWNVALRELATGRSAQGAVFMEGVFHVPVANQAAAGVCLLNGSWTAIPLSNTGVGVEWRNGDLVIRDAENAIQRTVARAGGEYRVTVSITHGLGRVCVWENGALLTFMTAIPAPNESNVLGAVVAAHTGTCTVERWWIGSIA